MDLSGLSNTASFISLLVGLSNTAKINDVNKLLNDRISKEVNSLNVDFKKYIEIFKDAGSNADTLAKIAALSENLTVLETELYSLSTISKLPSDLNDLLSPSIVSILSNLTLLGYNVRDVLELESAKLSQLANISANQAIEWDLFTENIKDILVNYKIDLDKLASQIKLNADMIFALSWEVVSLKEELRNKINGVSQLIDDSIKEINVSMADLNLATNNSSAIITSNGQLVLNDRAVIVNKAIARGVETFSEVAEVEGITLSSVNFTSGGTLNDAGLSSSFPYIVLDREVSLHIPNVDLANPLFVIFRTSAEGILKQSNVGCKLHIKNITETNVTYSVVNEIEIENKAIHNFDTGIGSHKGFVFPSIQKGVVKSLYYRVGLNKIYKDYSSLNNGEAPLSTISLPQLLSMRDRKSVV